VPVPSAKPPLIENLEGTASKNTDKAGGKGDETVSMIRTGKRKPNGTLYGAGQVGLIGLATDAKTNDEKGGVIDLKNRPTSSGVHLQ
jgi:hypothetical protein